MSGSVRLIEEIDWGCWRARDPATLVFVVQNGSILLIRKKRGLGAGKINGPGGRVEPGESPMEAAVREAEEELTITPLGLRFAGQNRFQFIDGYSIHVHVFSASDYRGEPRETAEAVPLWYPTDGIPYHEMWEDDRLWIPHLLEGRHFNGRYVFEGDTLLDYRLETAELPSD